MWAKWQGKTEAYFVLYKTSERFYFAWDLLPELEFFFSTLYILFIYSVIYKTMCWMNVWAVEKSAVLTRGVWEAKVACNWKTNGVTVLPSFWKDGKISLGLGEIIFGIGIVCEVCSIKKEKTKIFTVDKGASLQDLPTGGKGN